MQEARRAWIYSLTIKPRNAHPQVSSPSLGTVAGLFIISVRGARIMDRAWMFVQPDGRIQTNFVGAACSPGGGLRSILAQGKLTAIMRDAWKAKRYGDKGLHPQVHWWAHSQNRVQGFQAADTVLRAYKSRRNISWSFDRLWLCRVQVGGEVVEDKGFIACTELMLIHAMDFARCWRDYLPNLGRGRA